MPNASRAQPREMDTLARTLIQRVANLVTSSSKDHWVSLSRTKELATASNALREAAGVVTKELLVVKQDFSCTPIKKGITTAILAQT
jgi:hypothetical protein